MAFNAFANFGDIKGECTDKDHKDWVMILKYDHAITQPPSVSQKTAGGRSAEEVTHSEFSIVNLLDAATPKLHEPTSKGTHLPEVVIEVCHAREAKPDKYIEYKLNDVLFSASI